MHGFKTINEYTLKECADYLAQNEGGAYVEEVKARYVFLKEMTKREDADFEACKTADDFEKFIAKYKSVEAYQARHLEDAEKAKQRFITEAKRLEEERRRRKRRTFLIVLASLVVVAVIVILSVSPQGATPQDKVELKQIIAERMEKAAAVFE